MLLSWILHMWKLAAVTRRMRCRRWYNKLPRDCGARVRSLLPCLVPQRRGASPLLSQLRWLLSSSPALQGSGTATGSRRFPGLPRGISRTGELRGVLPPASFHRLPQPGEGIILRLTCDLESTLSSHQAKGKTPTGSSHRVQMKRHKCCCKGCKWGKKDS